ncbi:MAG TPA: hypothetical protein PLU64_12220 [Saprospiraceae bacterium]|nr:hypothetical protein [Saprospiraceae bacterium]
MPTILQTKTTLKRKVSDNIGNVLKELGVLVNPSQEAFNTLVSLEAAFKRLESQRMQGNIAREQMNVEYGSITARLLSFIDSLEEEDVLLLRLMQQEIFEHILVVAKSEARAAYLQQFFPSDYFRNLCYDSSARPLPATGIDIILYDDTPAPGPNEKDELLLHYLENTDAVVLYFGRHSPLVWEYPEKAYATNSVFSLHARIKEMTEYLKYKDAFEQQKQNGHD